MIDYRQRAELIRRSKEAKRKRDIETQARGSRSVPACGEDAENIERRRKYRREYYEKHRDAIQEYMRGYMRKKRHNN